MRLLVIATLMLSSVSTFANSEGSEFFWQAGAGKTYLIPELGYGKAEVDLKPSGSADQTLTVISLAGEYGLDDSMALGVELSFEKLETEPEGAQAWEASGLGDIQLYMKGAHGLAAGTLRYGATLGISPGKTKEEDNGDENAYSGRHTLTPYIGYETTADTLTFGGKLSYEIALTDQKYVDSSGDQTKFSGNDALGITLFTETVHAAGKMGASIEHEMTSDRKNETTGTKSSMYDITTLALYGDYGVNESTALTAELEYSMFGSSDAIKDGTAYALVVGARIAL